MKGRHVSSEQRGELGGAVPRTYRPVSIPQLCRCHHVLRCASDKVRGRRRNGPTAGNFVAVTSFCGAPATKLEGGGTGRRRVGEGLWGDSRRVVASAAMSDFLRDYLTV